MIRLFKSVAKIITKTVNEFIEDRCFQYSAAVSFYTLFSLAPIVIITVFAAGFFVGNEQVLSSLSGFLDESFGQEGSRAMLMLVETINTNNKNVLYLAISVFFLIFSATTVFVQFKDSFNQIFKVTVRPETGFLKVLLDRVISFGMILLLGAVMVLSLVLDSLLTLLAERVNAIEIIYAGLGSNLLSLLIIYFALLLMFAILPDVKLKRRPLVVGSFVTTLMLVIGKFVVGLLIGNSALNDLTGASSSVIILMLWVYYSSSFLFFGMELVKVLAERWEGEIRAGKYAKRIKMVDF
ncbi:YihY/virulence factor BrkB family protein [Gracilimonas mengyeensis]|uniref:Membrane protein n=1 Tax=Gracilimonas mengyeensis TaxID=1302730 RepID=A0A521CBN3_9BACT|nr:YihY/virulence factor BrkB family protein [Gracilimonas mengyeensis]SMO56826.1 membrane protein [Gracilimonas mengyeensis]